MSAGLSAAFLLVGSRILRAPLNLVIVALLARTLGPEGVGLYALVQAAAVMLHAGCLHWLQAPFVFFGRPEWQRTGGFAATFAARLPLLALGALLAGSLLAADPGQWLERLFRLPEESFLLVPLALFGIWLMAEGQSLCEITGSLRSLALAPVVSDCLIIAALVLVWVGRVPVSSAADALLLVYGIPALCWGCLVALVLGRDGSWSPGAVPSGRLREIVAYGWPLVPGLLIAWVFEWSAPLVLEHLLGKHEVGVYQVAFRISQAILALTVPLGSVLLPRLLSQQQHDPDAGRKFLASTAPVLVLLWLLLALPLLACLPELAGLLAGERFRAAGTVLALLAVAVPGSIVVTLGAALFTLQGRLFRMSVAYSLLMAAISLSLTLLLVPRLGILGAAGGTAAGYLAVQFAYLADQHRYLKLNMGPVLGVLALAVACAAGFALLADHLPARLVLCILGLAGLCLLARRRNLVPAGSLGGLLPPRWQRAEGLLQRLLCPSTGMKTQENAD